MTLLSKVYFLHNSFKSLLDKKNQVFQNNKVEKYMVDTILFDDIVDNFPKNKQYKHALLRIDIEGIFNIR